MATLQIPSPTGLQDQRNSKRITLGTAATAAAGLFLAGFFRVAIITRIVKIFSII